MLIACPTAMNAPYCGKRKSSFTTKALGPDRLFRNVILAIAEGSGLRKPKENRDSSLTLRMTFL
jgi:hypothetical protein